jgi:quinol monooxygenase YgiN
MVPTSCTIGEPGLASRLNFWAGKSQGTSRYPFLHLKGLRCRMFGAMLEKLMTDGVHVFDDDGSISVIAEIKAKAGHEEEIRVILHELVGPSRAEVGCEVYHLLEDKKHPGSFSTYEEWDHIASLRKHLAGDGAKVALEKAKPMLDGEMKLTILRKLL